MLFLMMAALPEGGGSREYLPEEAGNVLDIAVLNAIVRNFNGGPVGLNNLAAMVGEESETVETVCEPYLVREGFMIRTPKGRVATEKAWQHLGITPKDDVSKLF